jgi:leucyl-tRNA synthetase
VARCSAAPWRRCVDAVVTTWRLCSPQVNGKMRGTVEVSADVAQADALAAAKALDSVSRLLDGKDIKKVIFVPGRILNIIIGK